MAKLLLAGGRVAEIDDADLARLSRHSWHVSPRGYVTRWGKTEDGRETQVPLHRDVLGCTQNDGRIVDHRNGDRLDCRRDNLRLATATQNSWNSRRKSSNTSGFKGVSLHKASGRWSSRVTIDGRRRSLGYFDTPSEAHELYALAISMMHGEFANAG